MRNEYKEKFKVGTDGMHKLIYEDSSCYVELRAADVRDISIWVSIGKVTSKNATTAVKLTVEQRLQVYKRVSAAMRLEGRDGIYSDEFKLIEEEMENIDFTKDILNIEE